MVSRHEAADIRVHAPGAVEEHAAAGRNRVVLAEQVIEHRRARAVRMGALADVRELLRIAEQHDAACALSNGERVGERDLARLVDEEDVDGLAHLLARPQPCRAGIEQDLLVGRRIRGRT